MSLSFSTIHIELVLLLLRDRAYYYKESLALILILTGIHIHTSTMAVAYDHIQEETLASDNVDKKSQDQKQEANANTLNSDFQEAYKAISSSPWGARLGGFFGTVVKQVCGSCYVVETTQESLHATRVKQHTMKLPRSLQTLVKKHRKVLLVSDHQS